MNNMKRRDSHRCYKRFSYLATALLALAQPLLDPLQAAETKAASVDQERLVTAGTDPSNWVTGAEQQMNSITAA